MRMLLLLAAAALAAPLFAQDTACPAGASVAGYRCDPVPNGFASIVGAAGTVNVFLPPTDDLTVVVPFPAGYAITYYGVAKAGISICSNGFLTFTTVGPSASATNRHPEDGSVPNDVIFPWHDDLVVLAAGSTVDYLFDLTPGSETLTVQWTGVGNFVIDPPLTARGSFTFQCILYASTHTALPNRIEFRYDRSTAPPVMAPCQTANAGTLATSATVGCEASSATAALNVGGAEPTDRGAANEAFPPCDIRLSPLTYTASGQSATATLVAQEPFCHIEGLPGTIAIPAPCAAGACFEDDNSTRLMGVAIPLPWKVNLFGRVAKNAVMNSNGFMALGRGSSFTDFGNTATPSTSDPDLTLAPFWDDLEGSAASGLFFRVDGLPGCRVMTFEWHDFGRFATPGADCVPSAGSVTTQVKIFEGSAGSLASSVGPCPYDVVVAGNGNDRIEFHYDHAAFVPAAPTAFSATIGVENHKGSVGVTCLVGIANAAPPAGMKCVIDTCDFGQMRFYGDGNNNSPTPGACVPEIKGNCVPPMIGNAFGLQMVGSTPGAITFLLLDFGGPLPGIRTPVPCGGLPSPFGTFWVNPFAPSTLILPFGIGIASPGGPCQGCSSLDLPLPPDPALVGFLVFAQGAAVFPAPFGLLVELTEGAKIILGG
ncbi:MAG TPA: hypothetical protein VFI25_05370 [Planctomycetota bacterium]|jgi:hypothetical protein|nr:hypothetical protein [Planctomycetota bacterium]